MITHKITYIACFTLAIMLSSCQEKIDIDLNSAAPKIVIEGNVYDTPGPYTVSICKTVNLNELSIFPPVSGATVEISDDAGNSETLTESSPGTYSTQTIQGTPGRVYTLTVTANGTTYQAHSAMPNAVDIDSIYIEKDIIGDKYPEVKFSDPPSDNNYRLVLFVNGARQKGFNIISDKTVQGELVSYSLLTDSTLKANDNITVWLETIDKGVYEYFRTANVENGNSTSPSNPTSNISNGALGYFNACAVRKKSVVIP